MGMAQRILFGVMIIMADVITVFIPLTAFVLGYVLIARPRWFKEWIDSVYA